jgi:3-hydroxyacyl-CoA dehydrogenase
MRQTVAIIGSGSIGVAYAAVWADAGWTVHMADPDPARPPKARAELTAHLAALAAHGLLRSASPDDVLRRITDKQSSPGVVAGSYLIIECAPERLELKQQIFAELERHAPRDAILASSTSSFRMSDIAGSLDTRDRCLVLHPGNPPTLLRVVEVVPAPFTDPAVIDKASQYLEDAAMTPIVLKREIDGFIFNRLQGAVLREAYCLVRDGIADVEAIDAIMRDGLGFRWSVVGPFETADLNTRGGIASHAEKMGPPYHRMGKERGQDDPWTPDLVAEVARQRRALLPLEQWADRVAWRDRRLMELAAARRSRTG